MTLPDGGLLPADLRTDSARAEWNRVLAGRHLRDGRYLRGAFYLGSKDFYAWLRGLRGEDFEGLSMTRVSDINQLYGGQETLDALQRRDARFFNTCMMATALGAAVSDALESGQVVSGVGGQYNFVAMAHALEGGRSILLLRSTRDSKGTSHSNILWNYGHTTIPRHLRDIFVSEYGSADLRGKSDEDCILAMLAITDARFQDALAAQAKASGKLTATSSFPIAGAKIRLPALLLPWRHCRRVGCFRCSPSVRISLPTKWPCCPHCSACKAFPPASCAWPLFCFHPWEWAKPRQRRKPCCAAWGWIGRDAWVNGC